MFGLFRRSPPPAAADAPPPARRPPSAAELALEHLSEGLLVMDAQQRIVLANPATAALLNRPPAEAVGLRLWEVLRHRDVAEMADAARAGRSETREISLPGPDVRLYAVRSRPLPPEGAILFFEDRTHTRRLENLRRDFVANVSHELKTPLTALRAAIETLLDGAAEDPAAARDFLATADDQAARLQRLIDELLTLSRLEQPGLLPPAGDGASLGEVARRVIGALAPLARKAGVTLECAEGPEARVALTADETTRILTNLMDNGIKFNRPGGHVTLGWSADGTRARLTVADTGVGIEAADRERIFERFYRVDKARTRETGGTGLGLAIVKHLVEARGGRISVESDPGRGTTFIADLPRKP